MGALTSCLAARLHDLSSPRPPGGVTVSILTDGWWQHSSTSKLVVYIYYGFCKLLNYCRLFQLEYLDLDYLDLNWSNETANTTI